MLNPDHRRYFLVTGEPVLSKVNAYRKLYNEVRQTQWDFVKSVGGKAYVMNLVGGIGGVRFEGKPPEGFKPADKHGISRIRFRTPMAKAVAALPTLPNPEDYLTDIGYLKRVHYKVETPEGELSGNPFIGDPDMPVFIDWYSLEGPIMIAIPDQVLTCAALRRQYPGVVFVNDEHKHDPNLTGLTEVLLKEWELMEEKAKRGMQ